MNNKNKNICEELNSNKNYFKLSKNNSKLNEIH